MTGSERLLPHALRTRTSFAVIRLATLLRQECVDTLAAVGLGMHQHAVLLCLDEFGPAPQRDVAARLSVDSGDLVTFLDGLQEAGYIERARDQQDRRRQILTITESGRQILAEAEAALDGTATGVLRDLSAAEREQLSQLAVRALTTHSPENWA